ncbi:MAG: DUF4175 family protein [Flavobacteriaceae bacterium]|nr:DUF4175 family protein [Flavobacteriaceae bacterium]
MKTAAAEILNKLEGYIRKYYLNELLRGAIFFIALGLLYFLLITSLEYFLWLNTTFRTLLFWVFILVELGLFAWFVVRPVLGLFNIRRGLTVEAAAKNIGRHFPEVKDKLTNLLQLQTQDTDNELVLAAIRQKSVELKPIPFQIAINLQNNVPFLKYAFIPVLIILAILFTGKSDFFEGYSRVARFNTPFSPPPPFQFMLLNKALTAIENEDFTIRVKTVGDVVPETMSVFVNGKERLLKKIDAQSFAYTFENIKERKDFYFQSGKYNSEVYALTLLKVPAMLQMKMKLDYPSYTGKKDESMENTGNVTVPEGTQIRWEIRAKNTSQIVFEDRDSLRNFEKQNNLFVFDKTVQFNQTYALSSSNEALKNHERLQYNIEVVRDEMPVIKVRQLIDSLNPSVQYFAGQLSDDYGLKTLKLVYQIKNQVKTSKSILLSVKKGLIDQFTLSFPDSLDLLPGNAYEIYFEVGDNDGFNGSKVSRSETFFYNKKTSTETQAYLLNQQQNLMQNLDKTNDNIQKFDKQIEKLNELQKSKSNLSWNEQQALKDVIERQKQQESMMKKFSEDLMKSFQQNPEETPMQESLKERLEQNKNEAEANEKLLEELQKIADKLSQTELTERLEELAKQSKSRKKSLQQLLELTKRYYVEQKMQSIANQVSQLAEKQEQLSEESPDKNTAAEQEKMNERFDALKKDFDELEKDNAKLQKPVSIDRDQITEKEISKEQEKAQESLKQNKPEQAKPRQKRAAEKMKQMGQQMQQSMSMSGQDQLQEDIDVLRQIMENMLTFSMEQEKLMEKTDASERNTKGFSNVLKEQYYLREHFSHIDDSIFTLSLRHPEFSEKINQEIEKIYSFTDRSLEELSEYQIYKAASTQQYTLASANVLADFLSDILQNMQERMSGKGGGGEQGFQLPDIIQQQKTLTEQMEEKMGEQKGKEGKEGKDGEQGKESGQEKGKGSNNGESEENSEENYGELLEMLKQQQALNQALKDLIQKEGLTPPNTNLLKQAEQLEREMLMQGYNANVLEKMKNFQHQLLQLKDAVNKQNNEEQRVSKFNEKTFSQPDTMPLNIKEYFREIEILNRQPLPLQPSFKQKIKKYFTKDDSI